MKKVTLVACCLVLMALLPMVAAADYPSTPGERSFMGTKAELTKADSERQFRHTWLMSNHEKAAIAPHRVEIAAERWTSISEHDRAVGVIAETSMAFSTRAALTKGGLRLQEVPEGHVWVSAVEVPGALAVRPMFRNFDMPQGAELYIYNERGEVFGPYTGSRSGEFWANTITGSQLFVQVRLVGDLVDLRGAGFELAAVGAMDGNFVIGQMAADRAAEKTICSFNASCIDNAECSNLPSAIAPAQDAIGEMLYASGRYLYVCTGGLLADTDTSSQIPYFLTANHCISKGREASSLETYFFYTTPCNGPCYDFETAGLPRVLGSSIVKTASSSDYTLLQLDGPAPAGAYFLGWDSTPIAFDDGTQLYRISHPGGAPQAYSRHEVTTPPFECFQTDRGSWIYEDDVQGATEGGSSGSPVLNASGLVVGQLTGACGDNYDDVCDSASNRTIDGAFAAYYSSISQYLDNGGGSCTDADLDGACASQDCDDNDPNVYPGASEVCDGVDNDCDGTVDEGCGSCLAVGSSCSVNSDCCSNKCKGPSNNKTCK